MQPNAPKATFWHEFRAWVRIVFWPWLGAYER